MGPSSSTTKRRSTSSIYLSPGPCAAYQNLLAPRMAFALEAVNKGAPEEAHVGYAAFTGRASLALAAPGGAHRRPALDRRQASSLRGFATGDADGAGSSQPACAAEIRRGPHTLRGVRRPRSRPRATGRAGAASASHQAGFRPPTLAPPHRTPAARR